MRLYPASLDRWTDPIALRERGCGRAPIRLAQAGSPVRRTQRSLLLSCFCLVPIRLAQVNRSTGALAEKAAAAGSPCANRIGAIPVVATPALADDSRFRDRLSP